MTVLDRISLPVKRNQWLPIAVAWLLVATWLQLTRGSGHRAPDVMWAEDAVFYGQALRHPLWFNLGSPGTCR